LCVLTLAWFRL